MKNIVENIKNVTNSISENKIFYLILSFIGTFIWNEINTHINFGYNRYYGLNSIIKLKSTNVIYLFLIVILIIFIFKFFGDAYLKLIKISDKKLIFLNITLIWLYFSIIVLLLTCLLIITPFSSFFDLFKANFVTLLLIVLFCIISSLRGNEFQNFRIRLINFIFILSLYIIRNVFSVVLVIEVIILMLFIIINLQQILELFPKKNKSNEKDTIEKISVFFAFNILTFLSIIILLFSTQIIKYFNSIGQLFAEMNNNYLVTSFDNKDYLILPLEGNKGVFINILSSDETGFEIDRTSFKILSIEDIVLSYENIKVYPENNE